jgi:prevent-host-death family protein
LVKGFNNFVLTHDVKELDNRIGYDKLYITYRMYKMYKSVKNEKTWMERKLGLAKAREKFSEIIEQVQYQGESYVINRHGKPAAAVIGNSNGKPFLKLSVSCKRVTRNSILIKCGRM